MSLRPRPPPPPSSALVNDFNSLLRRLPLSSSSGRARTDSRTQIQQVFNIAGIRSRVVPRVPPERSAPEKGAHMEADDTTTVLQGEKYEMHRAIAETTMGKNKANNKKTLAATKAREGRRNG